MRREPFVYEVDTLVVGRDESLDFLFAEVVPISLMKGVTDFVEVPLEFRKVGLGKADAKLNDVVGRCWLGLCPSSRRLDALLDLVRAVLSGERSRKDSEGERKPGRERPHDS